MNNKKQITPSSVSPGRPGSAVFPTNPLGEKHEGIATGRDVEWEPLVDFRRMDISENTIHGAVAWAHGSEIVHSFGGNVLVYGRSMMKPLMMKAFAKNLKDVDDVKEYCITIINKLEERSARPEGRKAGLEMGLK